MEDNMEKLKTIISQANKIKVDLEAIYDEEAEAFDNMPEGLQYSYRGEASEEAQQSLLDAIDSIEEGLDYLQKAKEMYNE